MLSFNEPFCLPPSSVHSFTKDFMHNAIISQACQCFKHASGKLFTSLAIGLLLSACGGGSGNGSPAAPAPSGNASPAAPVPLTTLANTVVAYPSEAGELKVYAGQLRQVTLGFKTSDGGKASDLALALPTNGMPAGWTINGNRSRCEQVDGVDLCQLVLTYAPAAARQSSVVTFPYSYRNNKGEASTGSIAITYGALPVNAATATLLPGGPVLGMAGKTSSVVLRFDTNDGSPATDLHVENAPALLPAGWTSPDIGLECANFGAGSPCQLALGYTPASAAPASVLAINYRYKDSSGKQQAATASIDYSAIAQNTVSASFSPAGVVRARAGASQQVKLTFAPSDINPASGLRLTTDISTLPAEWAVKDSTLPCATVDRNGACAITLVYTPSPDQPAGKLDVDYAYTDAAGRQLTGKTTVSYASHDYRAYVTDFGGSENGMRNGGVRQCELDGNGKLSACVKASSSWPLYGANNIVIYNSRAYIGSETDIPSKSVTVCNIADDNALVDCTTTGPKFDRMSSLQVSSLGAFVISVDAGISRLGYCPLANNGSFDESKSWNCGFFSNTTLFKDIPDGVPTAMTSTDYRVYVSVTDRSTAQSLYSCSFFASTFLTCVPFAIGTPEQVVQRMSSWQAGSKGYLYLATASLSDPQKVAGSIVKCALNANGVVTGCEKGGVPPGMNEADLFNISDIRVVRDSAWLVTGDIELRKKVYQCQINQQTGDLAACVGAGDVEGTRNYSIAVR
jgi:hypothetical protein